MKKRYGLVALVLLGLSAFVLLEFLILYGFSETFVFALIALFCLFLFAFIIYYVNRLAEKRNVELIDYHEKLDDEYYRDSLKEYSPGSLMYIDNYTVDINTVIATLLSLKLKGYIDFNDGIQIINQNAINLSITESYIFNSIASGKIKLHSLVEFKKQCIYEAIENKFVVDEGNRKYFSIKNFLIFTSVIFITLMLRKYNIVDNDIFIRIIGFEIILLILYFSVVGVSTKVLMGRKRTKLGEEVNQKIEGLKIYLKDFSQMDKRRIEELHIWDEYLIYSVMFHQNKQIVDELEKYIEQTIY